MCRIITEVISMRPTNLHHKIITIQLVLLNALISLYEFAFVKKEVHVHTA
jgi:hypothetical protein